MSSPPAPIPDPSSPPERGSAARAVRWVPAGALVLFLAVLPVWTRDPVLLHVGVTLFLTVLLGSAWNLAGGYAGQCSVGHAAYFGVGAYAAVLLPERLQLPPWWGLPAAMASAALLGLVVGALTSRLRSARFVLATLVVAEIVRLAALHPRGPANGAAGLVVAGPAALRLMGWELSVGGTRPFYLLTLVLAVAAVAGSRAVRRSRFGHQLLAIREDEDAARSLGVRLTSTRSIALALSAALTGLAGAVFVRYAGVIDPNAVFGLDVSILMVLVCVLGGIGTVEGPVIGAVLLVPLDQALRNPRSLVSFGLLPPDSALIELVHRHLSQAPLFLHGLLLVLLVLFAPQGVAGLARRWTPRRRLASPARLPRA